MSPCPYFIKLQIVYAQSLFLVVLSLPNDKIPYIYISTYHIQTRYAQLFDFFIVDFCWPVVFVSVFVFFFIYLKFL